MIKIIEVLASYKMSFSEATRTAFRKAAKTVKNIKSIYIIKMNANVENQQIVLYGVNAKVSFEIQKQSNHLY